MEQEDVTIGAPLQNGKQHKKKSKSSIVQLLCLSLGLGVWLGFGLFYAFFRTQCADLVSKTRRHYSAAIASLQTQCELDSARLQDEYKESNSRESLSRQMSQLELQTAQAKRHQECLSRQDSTLARMSQIQHEQELSQTKMKGLYEEISSLQQTIQTSQSLRVEAKQRAENQHGRLNSQLELTKIMLQEKVDQLERFKLQGIANDCPEVDSILFLPAYQQHETTIVEMQAAIKRRSMALTVQSLGDSLPYTVIFVVARGPNRSSSTSSNSVVVEIEIDNVHDMPHEVYTFMTLIQAGLLHETSMQLRILETQEGDDAPFITVGGTPNNKNTSKRTRQYAEMGWNSERSLLFTERSTKRCSTNSVGFVNAGPEFAIWRTDPKNNIKETIHDNSSSVVHSFRCFGRVVSGIETLSEMEDEIEIGTIVDTRVAARGSTSRIDEL